MDGWERQYNVIMKSMDHRIRLSELRCWHYYLAKMTLGKLFNLSVPQSFQLQNEYDSSMY